MKYFTIYLSLIGVLVTSVSYSQIDYSQLYKEWCRCLPDNESHRSDTLRFQPKNLMTGCATEWHDDVFIHNDNLWYEFFPGDSMTVYEDGGNRYRPDWVPDTTISSVVTTDTSYDADGNMEITQTTHIVKTPLMYGMTGSAATQGISSYSINLATNEITIQESDGPLIYQLLSLSSNELRMRRVGKP